VEKRGFFKRSITSKFIVSVLLIIVVMITAMILLTSILLTRTFDSNIKYETEDSATFLSHNVRTFMNGAFQISSEVAANSDIRSMEEEQS